MTVPWGETMHLHWGKDDMPYVIGPELLALLEGCIALHEDKDSDYAGDEPYGNFMSSTRFGMRPDLAVMVRLSDKFHRIHTLRAKERRGEDPKVAETLTETLRDLINYAGIMVVIRNRLALGGVLPYRGEPNLTFSRFLLRRPHEQPAAPEEELFVSLEAGFDSLCRLLREEQDGMGRSPETHLPAICSVIVDEAASLFLARTA